MGEYLPGQKIRILAVDDHALLRGGLASLIAGQTDMELVGEAENGVEATRMCLTLRPDVTLMDIQMPKMDGVDATQQIRHAWPTARIIILTTYRGDIQARRAIKAGASGYLLKSSLRHELFDAIRAVQSGQECIPADIAREIASHIAGLGFIASRNTSTETRGNGLFQSTDRGCVKRRGRYCEGTHEVGDAQTRRKR